MTAGKLWTLCEDNLKTSPRSDEDAATHSRLSFAAMVRPLQRGLVTGSTMREELFPSADALRRLRGEPAP